MAQTVAGLADATKQVWTRDKLLKQFLDQNPVLQKIERLKRFNIGKEALVPIHKGRSGGYSVKPAAGGALNAADEQKLDQATYGLTHHYFQVELESAAVDQTDTDAKSVVNALDLEIEGATSDMRNQVTRQVFGNGDALIAQCTTTSSANEVELLSTGYGFDAIERGWLYPGLLVDIGTTANEVAIADGVEITAVEENESTPSITVSGSTVSTTTSHYVSVKDARSGTTSYEMNGLRQIAGSTTAAVGGLDPDTAGEEYWKPSYVDSSTTTLTLDAMLTGSRRIAQKTGKGADWVLTSLKQQENFYKLLQAQVRYQGEKGLGAGNVETPTYAGMEIDAQPEVPNREMYFLRREHLFLVGNDKPRWFSDYAGDKAGLQWKQGYTSFVDAISFRIQLATDKRNAFAAYTALTA